MYPAPPSARLKNRLGSFLDPTAYAFTGLLRSLFLAASSTSRLHSPPSRSCSSKLQARSSALFHWRAESTRSSVLGFRCEGLRAVDARRYKTGPTPLRVTKRSPLSWGSIERLRGPSTNLISALCYLSWAWSFEPMEPDSPRAARP